MLRSIVVIIFGMLSICTAFPAQITSYNGIPNNVEYDRSPFVKIGDNDYLIGTTEKLNWFGAVHQCRKNGAHLASIETADEMRALHEYLIAKYPDEKSFWVSGNDLSEKNHFQWLSTGQSMEYTNFKFPNLKDNKFNEDCVRIRNDCGLFKFMDFSCTASTKYICEADKPKEISITAW